MSMTIFPLGSDSDAERLPVSAFPPDLGSHSASTGPTDAAQLGDYLRVAYRHWRLICFAALGGCLCGLLLTLFQTPVYRAITSIEIQNINGDFLNMRDVRPVADNSQGTDAQMDLLTQLEILQSDSLAQSTVQFLKKSGALNGAKITRPLGVQILTHVDEQPIGPVDPLLKSVANSVKIKALGQTRMIRVQVDAPNPKLAAAFANTLITEYIQQNIKSKWQMTEAAGEWTRGQLTEMRSKLAASQEALQKYARDNQLVFTAERQSISDDRLRQVQSDLLRARTDLMEKQARRKLASSAVVDTLPDIAGDTELRDLRTRLIDLQRQEAELLIVFKPDYSDVRRVQAQIDELQIAIKGERDAVVSRITNAYSEASQKERLLNAAYDDAVHRAVNESQTEIQYDMLKRDVDSNLAAYQSMLSKVKELSLAAAFQTSNVRIVDKARPPERPYSPKMVLNIALGLFSGLTIGIAFVLFEDRSNESIRDPGEAMSRLGVPELAVIASTSEGASKLKWLSFSKSPAALEEAPKPFVDSETSRYFAGYRRLPNAVDLDHILRRARPPTETGGHYQFFASRGKDNRGQQPGGGVG